LDCREINVTAGGAKELSVDRTLMSVIRTSLSLIGFGFTIYQIFQKAHEAQILKSSAAPRNFGEAPVFLGIGMLVAGIGYHVAGRTSSRAGRLCGLVT
jgi:putative membrane protein